MKINCDVTVPKAGHEVLAAAVLRVHVAPLGARAVHSQAVALHQSGISIIVRRANQSSVLSIVEPIRRLHTWTSPLASRKVRELH